MQEKFTVVLEAVTKGFENKMQKVQDLAQKTSNAVKNKWKAVSDYVEPNKQVDVQPDVKENLFKTKMNNLKAFGTNVLNQIRSAWSGNRIDVDTQEATIKIMELKAQIRQLKTEMKSTTPGSRAFKEYASAIGSAEAELKQLTKAQKNANKEVDKTSAKSAGTGTNVTNAFSKMRNSVLRFALSLFSIQSILSGVSKASSEYLSADTDLANKLSSAWAGLGAFLAPIIEAIANKILKLVKYMNIFIKAVTGQDLLAKASKKATASLKKQNKATKELNHSLSDMDEITNISKDENKKTGAEGENPFKTFDDVPIDQGIAEKLEKLGKKVREFWDNILKPFFGWVKDNWKWLLPLVAAVGIGILLFGSRFKKSGKDLLGAKTNFTGFFDNLGKGLKNLMTLAGAAAILWALGTVIKEVSKLIQTFADSGLTLGEVAGLLAITLGELALAFAGIALATKLIDIQGAIGAIAVLGGMALVLSSVAKLLTAMNKTGMNAGDVFKTLAGVFGTMVVVMTAMSVLALLLGSNPLALIAVVALAASLSAILLVMAKTLPTILDAVSNFIVKSGPTLNMLLQTIFKGITDIIYAIGTTLPPIIREVSNLIQGILNTIKSAFKSAINFIIKGINVIIRGLNKVKIKTPDWIPKVGGKEVGFNLQQIPLLNVGTNYVPEDQLAYIHKGEAVIPKKFNSAEYFNNVNNNEETNALLLDLNRTMNELLEKDTNLYINGQQMARATYKDYKNEERRLGTSSIVSTR